MQSGPFYFMVKKRDLRNKRTTKPYDFESEQELREFVRDSFDLERADTLKTLAEGEQKSIENDVIKSQTVGNVELVI